MACLGFGDRREVFVDIAETLVHKVQNKTPNSFRARGIWYVLAHGAMEFLLALDAIPGVSITFFSSGDRLRNEPIIQHIMAEMKQRFGCSLSRSCRLLSRDKLSQTGKKQLSLVKRRWTMLERCVLVDNEMNRCAPGEDCNLLKIYSLSETMPNHFDACSSDQMRQVLSARVDNNLVRALGLILLCVHEDNMVGMLAAMQCDGQESNSKYVYDTGLAAMKHINNDFGLLVKDVFPWFNSTTLENRLQLRDSQLSLIYVLSVARVV